MNRIVLTAGAVVALLLAGPAFAESLPASQAAVAYGDIAIVEDTDGWQAVLAKQIKTPNHKGLGVYVSIECGLTTGTNVKSKGGQKETAEAEASVTLRVLVDGEEADPGVITFCRREQVLSASLGGILQDLSTADPDDTCLYTEGIDTNGDGDNDEFVVKIDLECVTPEEIELLLDTMGAHSYFFYYGDAAPGVHTVVVEAMVDSRVGADCELQDPQTECSTQIEDQQASAVIGHGSMGINTIRLVHGDDGDTLELQ